MRRRACAFFVLIAHGVFAGASMAQPGSPPRGPAGDEAVRRLAEEVRATGWIVFSARSSAGDWDLFACRPDGSSLRNLTNTPEYNEAWPQISRDGRRMLYRRLPRRENIDGNHYGAQGELVLAKSDGNGPQVLGASGEYPWASWSPDGRQIACLSVKGISLVDLATRQVVRTMPREGFLSAVDLVARRQMALRRGQFVRHRLERGPLGGRHGCGQRRQPRGLLHAGLVSRRPRNRLLQPAAGPKDKQRVRLDAALDGRCRGPLASARLWRGRAACLRRTRRRPTASTSFLPAMCRRTAIRGPPGRRWA